MRRDYRSTFLKIIILTVHTNIQETEMIGLAIIITRYPHEIHPPKKFTIFRGILSYDEIGLATNKIRL